MASLTPLSKGLIALAVVGAVASAVWNLGLKEKVGAGGTALPAPAGNAPTPAPHVAVPGPAAVVPSAPSPSTAPASASTSRLTVAENAEAGRKLQEAGNFAQARIHLEQAVEGGDGASACHLGEMTLHGRGGIKANQEKSASLFRIAQERGIICFASGK